MRSWLKNGARSKCKVRDAPPLAMRSNLMKTERDGGRKAEWKKNKYVFVLLIALLHRKCFYYYKCHFAGRNNSLF